MPDRDSALTIVPADTEVLPAADPLPPLTPKQMTWLEAYFRHGCNAAAATRELPTVKSQNVYGTAHEYAHSPAIRAHINARMRALGINIDALIMKAAEIAFAPASSFMQVIVPETKDKAGNVIRPMVVREDRSSQIKAIELLGRELGAFREKVDVNLSFVPKGFVLTQEELDSL